MICPKCELQAQADQKFCRSCGASLRITTQPLAELDTLSDLERPQRVGGSKGKAQRGNTFVLWGFITMFIGVAIGVLGKKLLHEDIVTVVGVLISLLGMFLTVYPFLAPSAREKNNFQPSSPPQIPTPSRPKESLPEARNIEYVSSITEGTTDLLKNPAATKAAQKENGQSKALVNQKEAKTD
jgi:hypothetical protein